MMASTYHKLALVTATLMFFLFLGAAPAYSDLLIKNARLIDGTERPPQDDVSIVVMGNRIAKIAAGNVDEAGMQVIDAKGMTVLPGLTDAHMHPSLIFRASSFFDPAFMDPKNSIHSEEDMQRFLKHDFPRRAKAILEMGITTLVDVGGFWPYTGQMRDMIRAGTVLGPRMFVSGPVLSAPGGHPSATVCFDKPWCIEHATVATNDNKVMRQKIKKLAKEGVDGLKMVYDDGADWVETPKGHLTKKNLQAIVDEAHRQNLTITAHIWNDEARAVEGVLAGLDGFVHFVPMDGENYRAEHGADLPALLNRHDVKVVTTFYALVTDTLLEWEPGDPDNKQNEAALAYIRKTLAPSVRKHLDAGVTLIFGTDRGLLTTGEYETKYAGYEVRTMKLAGLTESEILQTLTGNAAKHPITPEDIGTLEAGKLADIILVKADPLKDITGVFKPRVVIKNGEIVVDKR